jgi:molecular chaperone HtpG
MTETMRKKRSGKFKAEVSQVLNLVINSLYSNKEIFLRELLSNASDALDKLQFRALTDPSLTAGGGPLEVRIIADAEANTLTLQDDGVGMTKDELVANLGTVAHSGTQQFLAQAAAAKEGDLPGLIGQFGVGFYSAYLVADRVEVTSRAAGDDDDDGAWCWASDATDKWTLTPVAEGPERGTSIVLHLKEGLDHFLSDWTLRNLVTRYSDYVSFPIRLQVSERDDKGKITGSSFEQINRSAALWQRPKSELEDDDYTGFYKHLSGEGSDPLCWAHAVVEGTQQFTAVLYIPSQPAGDLYNPEASGGVRLYVQRVFILDQADTLLPSWLRFVVGVVDSDDLPLNVSRELLQDSATVRAIERQLTKRVLDRLAALATDDAEAYSTFWTHFGRVLKEGMHQAWQQRDKITELLRFNSSHGDALTSLKDYVERMPDDQETIYTITGPSLESVAASPHLEMLKDRGHEVLFCIDPVDEWVLDALTEYDGKPLRSALEAEAAGEGEETESLDQAMGEAYKSFTDRLGKPLEDRISEVRLSKRLTDSPCCLVIPQGGMSPHLERILRANGRELPPTKRIFEINADHPVISGLKAKFDDDAEAQGFDDWATLLHDQALLAEGGLPEDPSAFAKRMTRLMEQVLSD